MDEFKDRCNERSDALWKNIDALSKQIDTLSKQIDTLPEGQSKEYHKQYWSTLGMHTFSIGLIDIWKEEVKTQREEETPAPWVIAAKEIDHIRQEPWMSLKCDKKIIEEWKQVDRMKQFNQRLYDESDVALMFTLE